MEMVDARAERGPFVSGRDMEQDIHEAGRDWIAWVFEGVDAA